MKQFRKKLSKELAKIFEVEIEKVIQKEIDDPDYLPQSEFADSKTPCTDRADMMILDASPAIINTLAYAIAIHRNGKHGEDNVKEIDDLSLKLTTDQKAISTRTWWRG